MRHRSTALTAAVALIGVLIIGLTRQRGHDHVQQLHRPAQGLQETGQAYTPV
jgi:DNA-binding MurR/RpiR family transcriptional regulator